MRKFLARVQAVAVVLLVSAPVLAADDASRTILNDAIQAHGGADALAKTKAMTQSYKGELMSLGAPLPAACEETLQLPDRCRWSYELEAGAQKVVVLMALNSDKGWRSSGGAVKEMTRAEMDEQRDRAYTAWLMTLLPLRGEGFVLKALPETKVNDAPAAGFVVSHKDRPDVKLFFDKKTHLLVKVERKAKDAGQDVTLEYVLSEPKAFDGVKLATKRLELANSKKAAEWTLNGCKFPERLDESVFTKP